LNPWERKQQSHDLIAGKSLENSELYLLRIFLAYRLTDLKKLFPVRDQFGLELGYRFLSEGFLLLKAFFEQRLKPIERCVDLLEF